MNSRETRRNFLKNSAAALGAIPVLAVLGTSVDALAQAAPLPPLDPNAPVSKALGYLHDSTKVDAGKCPKHTPQQFCHNCNFFSAGGQKVEGQEGDWGKCAIFPQNLVNSQGWCNSWVVKPGT